MFFFWRIICSIKFDKTVRCQQYMKNIPQRTLEYNIGLVKYENPDNKDCFDLTTIHSLLIDHNPKFIDLKQLIVEYNSNQIQKKVNRPNLQRPFIQRLYKMLSELTRIPKSQNQLIYLNKIHAWAFHEDQNDNINTQNDTNNEKNRPATASTKTRPYSAYTKKTRPESGIQTKQQIPSMKKILQQKISKQIMEKHSNVDFKQLKHGQNQFFLGHRTIHPQQQKPRVRLKQYDRKILFQDPNDDEKFKQFMQDKKKTFKKEKLPEIPLEEQIVLPQEPKTQIQIIDGNVQVGEVILGEGVVPDGQQAGQEGAQLGQQELGLEQNAGGQQGGQQAVQQQQVQVIDKLRPRLKVYGDQLTGISRNNMQNYQKGIQKQLEQQNKLIRGIQQDKLMGDMMQEWAATKNRVKIQQRRRAQSARMVNRRVGVPFQKYKLQQKVSKQEEFNGIEVVDLSKVNPLQLKSTTRPITAFPSKSVRVYNQSIKDAMTSGNLDKHLFLQSQSNQIKADMLQRLGTFAAKPKKKTFQQILREAEDKVNQQTYQQIEKVKQKLANNRITIGGNRIFKSLSHQQPQVVDGQFVGQIIGQGMIKNPFFKVAKKKKKKKKKK